VTTRGQKKASSVQRSWDYKISSKTQNLWIRPLDFFTKSTIIIIRLLSTSMKKKFTILLDAMNSLIVRVLLFLYKRSKRLRILLRSLPLPRSLPFLRSLSSSRANVIVFFAVLVLLVGGGALYFYFPGIGNLGGDKKTDKKVDVLGEIKKGKLVGTSKLGETINMGNLEITLYNTKEGSYKTFERDISNNRISKTFFGANMKIFNTASGPGLENNEILFMSLQDDLGKVYERDPSIEFLLGNIKDYGPDKNVWPRTIREGYLLFPGPAKEAKSLTLTIYSEVSKEKVIFELVR